jgi:hypothetical protein
MSMIPSVRSIRESLLEQARQTAHDEVALATVRQDLEACARSVRRAIDRATDFAARGLVSEAASVIEDFPDLVRQAEALRVLSTGDDGVTRAAFQRIAAGAGQLPLPTQAEVDALAAIVMRAEETRAPLDALRTSALRGEPIAARLPILRRIRAADQRNRVWLDQIESLETAWLRQFAELRHRPDATRAELEQALAALESHDWVASVPRGLKEELLARAMPLRAEEAGERYRALANEIHDAASRMDRADLVRLEEAWARTSIETGRMPGAVLAASVAPAFEWLTKQDAAEREAAAFEAEVERLEIMLNERRPTADVERQISVLRDARRDAPVGLVERANSYIEAEREGIRRRHRLVLASATLATVVLGVVGFFLVRAAGEARQRAQELAALEAAMDAGEAAKARGIADAIRARGGGTDAALTAALDREDQIHRARVARNEEIRRLVSDLDAEFGRGVERPRALAIKDVLAAARPDAEEPERIAIDGLERRRIARLAELDRAADESSRAAAATADEGLRKWALPSAWTDEAQIDPKEWGEYVGALESARRALEAARVASSGSETAVSRIDLKLEGIDARLSEARSRQEALAAGLRELDPARLCAPVTVEADFSARLADALAKHGAILARQRRLGDFEAARDSGPMWDAIARWRDDHRPRLAALLGPALDGEVSADQQPRVLEIVNDYLALHPAGPMTDALKGLAARFDPTRTGSVWPAARVAEALAAARLADLEEVPLEGGRRFYRRPAAGVDPRNRAVENLGDLMGEPEKLDSILSVKREEIVGKPEPNEVSAAWGDALSRLNGAAMTDIRPVVLDLLLAVRASKCDALLRLRAMREAVDVLEQAGHMPAALERPLSDWRESMRKSARGAAVADWLRAGYEPEVNFREERREADAALERFPDLEGVIAASRGEQARAAGILQPLVPWGVLAPADGQGARAVVGRRDSGRFFAVAKTAGAWEIVPVDVTDGVANGVVGQAASLPRGPVLIFRRLNQ